jgi:sialidase-1
MARSPSSLAAFVCAAAVLAVGVSGAAAEVEPPRRLPAEHGVVCRLPAGERRSYFGWPTVARMDDGTLLVASSGLREEHVCHMGKTVLNVSRDDGRTWSEPRVIQDSMIDDRDAGIISLGGQKLLVAWFRLDTRRGEGISAAQRASWAEALKSWTDEEVSRLVGSWVMLSDDAGATWGDPLRAPVSAPHGPVRLRDGDLLYFGKRMQTFEDLFSGPIDAARSSDGGRTWTVVGSVPVAPKTVQANYHEPHAVELPSGRLLGAIRIEDDSSSKTVAGSAIPHFSIMLTESDDGGATWSEPRSLGFHGSPPHLLRHSSGALVMSYGYREKPYGQRVAISRDDGRTWDHDFVVRDDGPDGDLGYPSTVELADGSLLTVCYQRAAAAEKCSLLWSRWKLP